MKYTKGRHPGAVWRKTDLQVHTPRDAGWQGSNPLPGGNPEKEAAREAWADQFVAECLQRSLGAIGVTDHHDIVMYPYVERAIARSNVGKSLLWVFPGMEVTCNDSVQCLMLFDQGTPPEVIRRLFGLMPRITEPNSNHAKAPQAQLCGKGVDEFLAATFEDSALTGRSIVLPHASKGGHKDILRQGFHQRFADLAVDGVYNEKSYNDLDVITRKKIYGELRDWGDRRHGIITTGDNRHANYGCLGINSCWIRLGEPTAEALRQAVLADEARIVYSPPSIPSQRVVELRVVSSLTGGDFGLIFNDGFNALIGGRGSGKSTLLEYLRFGLGRSCVDMTGDETSERERDLINSTLVGGYIEVELERDGVREIWRRTLAQQAVIRVTSPGVEAVDLPIAVAHERFRARAFSQKQLSTLVRRADTADEQITGIAAAELVDRRRQAEQEIETAQRDVNSAFQRLVQAWAARAACDRAATTTADIKRRLEAIRQRLEQEGLSASQQATLDEAPGYTRTDGHFDTSAHAIDERLSAISELRQLDIDKWELSLDFPEVVEARKLLEVANNKIEQVKDELRLALASALDGLAIQYSTFKSRHLAFKAKYMEASAAQSQLGDLVNDYKRLTSELEQAERHQRMADETRKNFSKADDELAEARRTLSSRLSALHKVLSEAAQQVETMSAGILRASVDEEAIPGRYLSALTDLCERCGIRDLESRCKARVEELARDSRVEWEKLVQRLVELRRHRMSAGDTGESDPNAFTELRTAFGLELTDKQASQVMTRLDDARLARMLSAWASPFIRFEYKDRGSYVAFERASPGQQASALLTLLLNQEAGTLIIDQPEDDLDNRVIMSIVKLLQTTKRKRQLIFATHNPNFVVNGDADKVVALSPSVDPNATASTTAAQITIETDGAIETPEVRTAITDTMEGGRAAFELRSRKYAFATKDVTSQS